MLLQIVSRMGPLEATKVSHGNQDANMPSQLNSKKSDEHEQQSKCASVLCKIMKRAKAETEEMGTPGAMSSHVRTLI